MSSGAAAYKVDIRATKRAEHYPLRARVIPPLPAPKKGGGENFNQVNFNQVVRNAPKHNTTKHKTWRNRLRHVRRPKSLLPPKRGEGNFNQEVTLALRG